MPENTGAGFGAGLYLICYCRFEEVKSMLRRKVVRKERGVFGKVPGSEIWWIRYYVDGRDTGKR
jgi:hypothetical protein